MNECPLKRDHLIKEVSSSNHQISEDMLVFRGVMFSLPDFAAGWNMRLWRGRCTYVHTSWGVSKCMNFLHISWSFGVPEETAIQIWLKKKSWKTGDWKTTFLFFRLYLFFRFFNDKLSISVVLGWCYRNSASTVVSAQKPFAAWCRPAHFHELFAL